MLAFGVASLELFGQSGVAASCFWLVPMVGCCLDLVGSRAEYHSIG